MDNYEQNNYNQMIKDCKKIKQELGHNPTAQLTANLLLACKHFLIDNAANTNGIDLECMSVEQIIELSLKGQMK